LFVLSVCDTCAYVRKRAVCANTELSDTIRNQILTFHNDARRRVANGVEPNKVGTLNPAKNMYKLEWDCTMEQQAQDALASCPSGLGSWPNMAQNMMTWTSSAGFPNPGAQVNTTLNTWWGAAKLYGVTDTNNKYTTSSLYNFANMVFSETSKIGCAYKICNSNKLIFTCLYNGIGYYTNAPMWETGSACTTGSECTTFSNSGCDAGLCTKGAPVPETNVQCSANSGMSDSVRQKFLELHNGYR
ncbi:SCP domain-containing protein, partial [Trichostrongylus colubriformis]